MVGDAGRRRMRARHGLGIVGDAARRRIRARHGLGEWKTTLRAAGYGRGMASPLLLAVVSQKAFKSRNCLVDHFQLREKYEPQVVRPGPVEGRAVHKQRDCQELRV